MGCSFLNVFLERFSLIFRSWKSIKVQLENVLSIHLFHALEAGTVKLCVSRYGEKPLETVAQGRRYVISWQYKKRLKFKTVGLQFVLCSSSGLSLKHKEIEVWNVELYDKNNRYFIYLHSFFYCKVKEVHCLRIRKWSKKKKYSVRFFLYLVRMTE